MAIAISNIIDADDYNGIRNKILKVLGDDGVNQKIGYGRSLQSSARSAGDIVTSADMDNLFEDLKTIRQHHLGLAVTDPSFVWSLNNADALNSPDSGEFIGAEAADIGDGGTSADATADEGEGFVDFDGVAADAQAFAINFPTSFPGAGSFTVDGLVSDTRTTNWSTEVNHEVTIRWPNADARRYFFNAGGRLRISAGLTGGTSDPNVDGTTTYPASPAYSKDEIWQTMLNTMGNITFGRDGTTNTGSGTAATAVGNYQMTSSDQVIFTKSGSGVYAENFYEIKAREVDTRSIRFTIRFVDADTGDDRSPSDPYPNRVDESITGDITSTIQSVTPDVFLGIPAPSATQDTTLEDSTPATNYSLSTNVTEVNEGGTFDVTLDTTGLPNGTNVAYTITGVTSADISGASLTGNFNIQSNTRTITFTAAADALTDGSDETFSLTLDNGQGGTAEVIIRDTSVSAGVSNWPAAIPHTDWGDQQQFVIGDGVVTSARATADVKVTFDGANSRVAITTRTFGESPGGSPTEYTGYITYSNLVGTVTVEARYRVGTQNTNANESSSTPSQTASQYITIPGAGSETFTWIADDSSVDTATRGLTTANSVYFDVRITDSNGSFVKSSAVQTVDLEAQYSESAQAINSTWSATAPVGATPPSTGSPPPGYGFTLSSSGVTDVSVDSGYGVEGYTFVPANADIIDWLPNGNAADYEANVTVVTGSASSLQVVRGGSNIVSTATWYSLDTSLSAEILEPGPVSDTVVINLKIRKIGAGTVYDVNQNINLSIDNTNAQRSFTLTSNDYTPNEGDTITMTFTTTGPDSDNFWWRLSSLGAFGTADDVDFTSAPPRSDGAAIQFNPTNGEFEFDISFAADSLTEGSEYFTVFVFDRDPEDLSGLEGLVASRRIDIVDTSLSPPVTLPSSSMNVNADSSGLTGSCSASFSIGPSGEIRPGGSGNPYQTTNLPYTWLSSGNASDYEVRWAWTARTNGGGTITDDAGRDWLNLGTLREWRIFDNSNDIGQNLMSGTIEIRDATTQQVLASGAIGLSADQNP